MEEIRNAYRPIVRHELYSDRSNFTKGGKWLHHKVDRITHSDDHASIKIREFDWETAVKAYVPSKTKSGLVRDPVTRNPRRHNPHFEAIERRVSELRAEALENDDVFDEGSAKALLSYCNSLSTDVKPSVFLLANGNLRAVWQSKNKDQIGIQIINDRQFQFVILRDRDGRTLKTLGVEEPNTIEQIVGLLGLRGLWFDE